MITILVARLNDAGVTNNLCYICVIMCYVTLCYETLHCGVDLTSDVHYYDHLCTVTKAYGKYYKAL